MVDFAGWQRKLLADGLILYPPGGRGVGAIRIRDRVQPLEPVRAIAAKACATGAVMLKDQQVGPLERLTTLEGEFAALVGITALRSADDRPVERLLGFVFAEDFYVYVDGIVQEPAQLVTFREHVREVVVRSSLGLGTLRRRRYAYTPPRGWQAIARTMMSDWYPPDYPKDHAVLSVFHAKPPVANATTVFERMLREDLPAGFVHDAGPPPVPVATQQGLNGEVITVSGQYEGSARRHFELAVLLDTRFLYLVRLESGDERLAEHRAAHRALVESVLPLPPPVQRAEEGAMIHWTT